MSAELQVSPPREQAIKIYSLINFAVLEALYNLMREIYFNRTVH